MSLASFQTFWRGRNCPVRFILPVVPLHCQIIFASPTVCLSVHFRFPDLPRLFYPQLLVLLQLFATLPRVSCVEKSLFLRLNFPAACISPEVFCALVVSLLMHICVFRPQDSKDSKIYFGDIKTKVSQLLFLTTNVTYPRAPYNGELQWTNIRIDNDQRVSLFYAKVTDLGLMACFIENDVDIYNRLHCICFCWFLSPVSLSGLSSSHGMPYAGLIYQRIS